MDGNRTRSFGTALTAAALLVGLTACSAGSDEAVTPGLSAANGGLPTTAASTAPTTAPASSAPPVQRVFPVQGKASYEHDHHGYPATDIMAACGLAYVAPMTGVVLEVDRVDDYDPKTNVGVTRGGLSVSLLGDDGVRYYGSHFSAIEAFVEPGVRVSAGQRLATVGRTGDASACHVHFGLSAACARTGDWWNRRGMIWPWKYLDSWRSGGNLEPGPEVQQWQATNGCPDHPLVEA
jgi:murein DD-endopeptidase MepM/ murein hydrolase activator NlpD